MGSNCLDLNRTYTQINRRGRVNKRHTSVQHWGSKKPTARHLEQEQVDSKLRHVVWTSFCFSLELASDRVVATFGASAALAFS